MSAERYRANRDECLRTAKEFEARAYEANQNAAEAYDDVVRSIWTTRALTYGDMAESWRANAKVWQALVDSEER